MINSLICIVQNLQKQTDADAANLDIFYETNETFYKNNDTSDEVIEEQPYKCQALLISNRLSNDNIVSRLLIPYDATQIFCRVVISYIVSLFRNKRFMLDEMTWQNASKFAIFYIYENPKLIFPFFVTLFLPFSMST